MNKRQVIILWAIALALGAAVTAVKLSQNQSTLSATNRAQGQTLFESFPAADASSIEIQGVTESVSLVKKDGKWVVTQRDGYPANNTYVNDLIRTLGHRARRSRHDRDFQGCFRQGNRQGFAR